MKDPLPRSYKYALLCSMHYALCTMLYALCSMDYALLCSMHYALFSIHNALTLRRSQVSRRLDLLFAGGSKLHYCHSKDHKVASLETRGRYPRLSTGICPRKLSPLSRLFCDNILPQSSWWRVNQALFIVVWVEDTQNTPPRSYITNSQIQIHTPARTLQIQGGGEFIAPSGIENATAVFCRILC